MARAVPLEELSTRTFLRHLMHAHGSKITQLPRPVLDIIADYVGGWMLTSLATGIYGPIGFLSMRGVEHKGPKSPAWIHGNTAFASGQHAWRVTLDGFRNGDGWMAVGIILAQTGRRKQYSYKDPSFYGVTTEGDVFLGGSKHGQRQLCWHGLRNGASLDFLLDVDANTLSVFLRQPAPRRAPVMLSVPLTSEAPAVLEPGPALEPEPDEYAFTQWELRRSRRDFRGWLPHFYMLRRGNRFVCEELLPELAGQEVRAHCRLRSSEDLEPTQE